MKDSPKRQFVRLPNGEVVRIESREGKSALMRRIEGPRKGNRAVCAIAKLQLTKQDDDSAFVGSPD